MRFAIVNTGSMCLLLTNKCGSSQWMPTTKIAHEVSSPSEETADTAANTIFIE